MFWNQLGSVFQGNPCIITVGISICSLFMSHLISFQQIILVLACSYNCSSLEWEFGMLETLLIKIVIVLQSVFFKITKIFSTNLRHFVILFNFIFYYFIFKGDSSLTCTTNLWYCHTTNIYFDLKKFNPDATNDRLVLRVTILYGKKFYAVNQVSNVLIMQMVFK